MHVRLLSMQLKRAGWWTNVERKMLTAQDAWAMSQYLSREYALTDDRAAGGARCMSASAPYQNDWTLGSCQFEDHVVSLKAAAHLRSPVCATSLCGRYFVSAVGHWISVYRIANNAIYLVSRVACESAVLALAIDVNPVRVALAAVLEGRSGIFLDLSAQNVSYDESWCERSGSIISAAPATCPILNLHTTDGASNAVDHVFSIKGESFSPGQLDFSALWPETINLRQIPGSSQDEKRSRTLAIYRNLCTTEDPPFSVAIGPSSQCVAFGCRKGVELYWIDQVTGQNLNRWFHLSHPSHHLHFLPPRRFQDSPSRLRLISTTRPRRPDTDQHTVSISNASECSNWFTLRASWGWPDGLNAASDVSSPNHSHAVPLSDGHHILFVDNEVGRLCIGSEQPSGVSQRLSRKLILEPPIKVLESSPGLPSHYASATDTHNGIRVVASYGDQIILYSVPVDVAKFSTAEQEQTLSNSSLQIGDDSYADILNHPTSTAGALQEAGLVDGPGLRLDKVNMAWVHYLGTSYRSTGSIWPLRLTGILVGSMESVESLAIHDDAAEGLVVWAFSGSRGVAKSWRVSA